MKGSLICFLDEDERFMEYGQTQRRILPKKADPFLDIYFFLSEKRIGALVSIIRQLCFYSEE